jgi:hypothetical protein
MLGSVRFPGEPSGRYLFPGSPLYDRAQLQIGVRVVAWKLRYFLPGIFLNNLDKFTGATMKNARVFAKMSKIPPPHF